MSVLKRKRKDSQFEVFHHLYRLRREMKEVDKLPLHNKELNKHESE